MPAKFGDPRSRRALTNAAKLFTSSLTNFISSNRTAPSLNCFCLRFVIAELIDREVRILLLSLHAFAFLPRCNPGMILL